MRDKKHHTIRFNSKTSLVQLEGVCESIDDAREQTDVFIPKHLSFGGAFGISIALSQVIAKWARHSNRGSLTVARTKSHSSDFDGLALYPHGLISMFMSQEFIDKNEPIDRDEVLKLATPTVESMNNYRFDQTQKGQGVFLSCFSGTRNEFLKPLYSRPTTEKGLRSTGDFRSLIRKLLESSDAKFVKKSNDGTINSLASLIFELIENTNDHGTKSEDGFTFDYKNPNARGVLVKKVVIGKGQNVPALTADRKTAIWSTRALLNTNHASSNRLEVSVFDFGMGIARSRLHAKGLNTRLEEISFHEEEKLVKSSFTLGVTSKQESGAGSGLDTAVKCLVELGASIRLRTGRLCYWQDFTKSKERFDPIHFIEEKPLLSDVPGTLFTILIPLI